MTYLIKKYYENFLKFQKRNIKYQLLNFIIDNIKIGLKNKIFNNTFIKLLRFYYML